MTWHRPPTNLFCNRSADAVLSKTIIVNRNRHLPAGLPSIESSSTPAQTYEVKLETGSRSASGTRPLHGYAEHFTLPPFHFLPAPTRAPALSYLSTKYIRSNIGPHRPYPSSFRHRVR